MNGEVSITSLPTAGQKISLGSCHRTHQKPDFTNTLLAVNMYSNFEIQFGLNDEYDSGTLMNERSITEVVHTNLDFRHRFGIRRI